MVRKLAVRKVLKLTRELKFVDYVVAISLSLSILGFILYTVYVPSSVVLMEGFVWLIEALTFLGLLIAFKIATSRAAFYGARYEIFRIESFAVVLVSIIAGAITIFNMLHTLEAIHHESRTPIEASLYLLGSAAISYMLSRQTRKVLEVRKVFILTAKTIEEKLGLDVVFEAGGGIAIVVSNLMDMSLIEVLTAVAMGVYVLIGVFLIARDAFLHLIGIGSKKLISKTRRDVISTLRKVTRFRLRKIRIETLGSFAEVELWLEAPPNLTLNTAHRHAVSIAREVVLRVPEVVRALVIIVPRSQRPSTPRRTMYYRRITVHAHRVDTEKESSSSSERGDSAKA